MKETKEVTRARLSAKKYLNDLARVHHGPAEAAKRARIYQKIAYGLGVSALFIVLLFHEILPELLNYALAGCAGISIAFSHFFSETARNITLLVKVIDWKKVERLRKRL